MTEHRTGTRKEWLAARLALLEEEKELTRWGDALAQKRQALPWVRVDKEYRFDTDDAAVVSAQLAERGVTYEWLDDGSLNMWTSLPATTTHPVTGDVLLFNQLHAQHQHRFLIGDARADLMDAAYGATLPRPYQPTFGGGDPLTDAEYFAIQDEVESRLTRFTWRPGDMMLVENKLTAHGRKPYKGERDVQVMLLD